MHRGAKSVDGLVQHRQIAGKTTQFFQYFAAFALRVCVGRWLVVAIEHQQHRQKGIDGLSQ
jgi:hypothetical protein